MDKQESRLKNAHRLFDIARNLPPQDQRSYVNRIWRHAVRRGDRANVARHHPDLMNLIWKDITEKERQNINEVHDKYWGGGYEDRMKQERWKLPEELQSWLGARDGGEVEQLQEPMNIVPGFNYLGPGNSMNRGAPINLADAAAQEHDEAYDIAADQEDIATADDHAMHDAFSDLLENGISNPMGAIGDIELIGGLGTKRIAEKVAGGNIYGLDESESSVEVKPLSNKKAKTEDEYEKVREEIAAKDKARRDKSYKRILDKRIKV